MIARAIIIGIQLIGTLLIVAALLSGFFAIVALMVAVVFSPIQSVAAAFSQTKGVKIAAFVFATVPSLLMIVALFQRQVWIDQCRISGGCSGLADGAINAIPWMAASTFIPFTLCLATTFWHGLGAGSLLSVRTRVAVVCIAFAPLVLTYGAGLV